MKNRFGKELRRLRRAHGLNLVDLADASGMSVVYLSDIERGDRKPPSEEKIRLLMARMDEDDKTERMFVLAAQSRKSIEVSLKDASESETQAILALARRIDEKTLPPEWEEELKKLLKRLGAKK
ncbi:MAG TPA: transcriptional regulator [Planctomycetaceae bacterium]|jgi:transcriptional regulator with XRE-family HTH domain